MPPRRGRHALRASSRYAPRSARSGCGPRAAGDLDALLDRGRVAVQRAGDDAGWTDERDVAEVLAAADRQVHHALVKERVVVDEVDRLLARLRDGNLGQRADGVQDIAER